MFSGCYNIEEDEGSGVFLDRDGSVFGTCWPISVTVMEWWLLANIDMT
jgi:hypothetical protein